MPEKVNKAAWHAWYNISLLVLTLGYCVPPHTSEEHCTLMTLLQAKEVSLQSMITKRTECSNFKIYSSKRHLAINPPLKTVFCCSTHLSHYFCYFLKPSCKSSFVNASSCSVVSALMFRFDSLIFHIHFDFEEGPVVAQC